MIQQNWLLLKTSFVYFQKMETFKLSFLTFTLGLGEHSCLLLAYTTKVPKKKCPSMSVEHKNNKTADGISLPTMSCKDRSVLQQ